MMSPSTYVGGPNEEQFVLALKRAIAEHGTPNTFYPREIWLDYRGPHQIIIGTLLRSGPILADIERHVGASVRYERPTGRGHCDGNRIVVEASPVAPPPETERPR